VLTASVVVVNIKQYILR